MDIIEIIDGYLVYNNDFYSAFHNNISTRFTKICCLPKIHKKKKYANNNITFR